MIEHVKVKDKDAGQIKAHDILKKIVDKNTLLALSGGTSMDYKKMIVSPPLRQGFEGQADDIIPGAICVVDERYGEPFHKDSNEKLLADAGIKEFADKHCIESRKILCGKSFDETTKFYGDVISQLFKKFPKRVGVMGVGSNVHTAGVFHGSLAAKSADLVVGEEVDDKFPKRITLTIRALGEFTNFVVMMFGQEKKDALKIMLDEGENDMQKYPAIFYRKDPVKSFVITDIVL
ncbi:MAG: 6-phosphogluconolactonase [Patescibacteria group bacterium]